MSDLAYELAVSTVIKADEDQLTTPNIGDGDWKPTTGTSQLARVSVMGLGEWLQRFNSTHEELEDLSPKMNRVSALGVTEETPTS